MHAQEGPDDCYVKSFEQRWSNRPMKMQTQFVVYDVSSFTYEFLKSATVHNTVQFYQTIVIQRYVNCTYDLQIQCVCIC